MMNTNRRSIRLVMKSDRRAIRLKTSQCITSRPQSLASHEVLVACRALRPSVLPQGTHTGSLLAAAFVAGFGFRIPGFRFRVSGVAGRLPAKRERLKTCYELSPGGQGRNVAPTDLLVPNSLDSDPGESLTRPCLPCGLWQACVPLFVAGLPTGREEIVTKSRLICC